MVETGQERFAIGIDIGGTGIKAALVDTLTGRLPFKKLRVLTPRPSTPEAMAAAIAEVIELVIARALELGLSDDRGALESLPLGCGFPGAIRDGKVTFTGNLDPSWIGCEIQSYLAEAIGHELYMLNDADAAGLAEMSFGAGRKHRKKTVLMTTLGTGIGSALFTRGWLVPYTELGHIEMNGRSAEEQAAESVKVREELDFAQWADRLQQYYSRIELLVAPDLIIVGGGISKSHEHFLPLLSTRAPLRPAKLFNNAGIVGAAVLAARGGKAKIVKSS